MLDKLKKYKFILVFLLFILFLLINNKVNATSINFEYEGKKYSTILPNEEATNYVVFVTTRNEIYLSFTKGLYLGTTNKANDVKCYQFSEYSSIWGNTKCGIRYKDAEGNHLEEFRYKLDTNHSSWTYSNGGWDGFVGYVNVTAILFSNCDVYDNNCQNIIYTANKSFPSWHIEYYEPYEMYYAFTDWYDIRKIPLTIFYAYGDHLSYSGDFYNIDDYWDWEGEVTEMKEDDECIQRTGFPLNVYGHYSYLQLDLNDHTYVLDGLDFTEETLKGSQYEDCLNPLTHLNLYLDERTGTPTVYSNYIDNDLLEYYSFILNEKTSSYYFQISFDGGNNYNSINIECKEEKEINGKKYTRFYYKLFANGTYTFKLTINKNVGVDKDKFDKYEVIKTFTITSYEEIIDKNGNDYLSATPFITAYADGNRFRFSSQKLYDRATIYILDHPYEDLRYKAYYIDEDAYQIFGDNYSSWIVMETIHEGYDFSVKTSPYHFETDFPYEDINDGDKFYFVFFDQKLGSWSNVTIYVVESKVDVYTTSQNITFNNDKFQRLYDFFYNHFGFLMYPLEFVMNLLNRVLNINYSEPIIQIPVLKVPTTETVIFNGYSYNFNSLLQNKAVANIYNIYLVAVDFCIVIALVLHAKKVAEEVFTKNG